MNKSLNFSICVLYIEKPISVGIVFPCTLLIGWIEIWTFIKCPKMKSIDRLLGRKTRSLHNAVNMYYILKIC